MRLFTPDDVQIMYELCSDPEVIKYADTPVVFARSDLKIKKLVALIMPKNIASIKLAEKLGMQQGPLISVFDIEAFQYEMML